MKLPDPNAYYADRAIEHTAQGDIYAGIPLVQATHVDPSFEAAGARKRPGGPDPDHSTSVTFTGFAIVLHYTRGFTAQPPGTRGYAHEHRLVAPIVSLRELRRWRMGNNELRKIRDGATIQGFMYLPQVGAVLLDAPEDGEDSGQATRLPSSTAGGRHAGPARPPAPDRAPHGRCDANPRRLDHPDVHAEQLRVGVAR